MWRGLQEILQSTYNIRRVEKKENSLHGKAAVDLDAFLRAAQDEHGLEGVGDLDHEGPVLAETGRSLQAAARLQTTIQVVRMEEHRLDAAQYQLQELMKV